MARKALWIIVLAVVVLVMAWLRVCLAGHQARTQADRLMAGGRADEAIGFYDRALHMYWPGSPDIAHAVRRLTAIAEQREKSNDLPGAVHAWRILRSGLYAARGLYQPYPEVIRHAEERIAELVALELKNPAERPKELALMQRNQDPSRAWSMTALLGFALWVGSALGFLWRALTPDGRLLTKPALMWSAVFIAGYVVWLVGLSLA
jgi:hypothetical protein